MRAFLYPVVKHCSISLLRKRRNVVDLDVFLEKGMEADVGVWEPELPSDFDRLIRDLPAGHQEVVRLRFVLDLKLHEIAEELGIPLGTVKSRLHTAIKTLREKSTSQSE
jgi:RNA polymerase sigma-70 factor (ECF subfamily)